MRIRHRSSESHPSGTDCGKHSVSLHLLTDTYALLTVTDYYYGLNIPYDLPFFLLSLSFLLYYCIQLYTSFSLCQAKVINKSVFADHTKYTLKMEYIITRAPVQPTPSLLSSINIILPRFLSDEILLLPEPA